MLTGSISQVSHQLFLILQRVLLTGEALKAAKKHGVKVSVGLNFRKKLWSSEKAQKVRKNLMQYVDVCIGNEEDAELVLGYKPGNTDVTSGDLELAEFTSQSSNRW